MKKFSVIPLIAALAVFVSCQKQQTEEERKAEVERQVQDRLAAERVEAEKKRIEEDRAKLDAREKAIADRETAAMASPTPAEEPAVATQETVTTERVEAEPQSSAAYGMFYEKLDPYGEWRETSDYGYVWQPREAESSRDWRPYTEGRWVYSDAGWTWVSDEPFGWATYHYGRWARLRRVGWVWVPGNEWAPAWVSWRTNKDYVGWAPLPPEARFDRRSGIQNWADSYYDIGPDQYSFVPSNDFSAEHVRRSVVPAERNVTIVVETTNVTRITFSNTTIVNEGPSYDELRSRSQRPIERYRLRRERNVDSTARISGNELQVSIPVLSEVQNVFRPRRVKERVTDVNVDNGWTSVSDRSAAERARTKIRTEATPPPNAPSKKFVPPAETSTVTASATPAPTAASPPPAAATPTPGSAASATPAASALPRIRPSVAPRTQPSPSIAASPAATAPAVATTPASPPVASPRAATATPTPSTAITPPVRMRPSPSIPSRPLQTPPAVQRRVPPITPTPATTPAAESQPATTPAPTFTPPPRRSNVPPRPSLTPANTADTAQPPMPRDNPKRIIPPRMTPPPATAPAATPNASPSAPAPNNDRARNRRPKPPVPGATESGTPTPAPQ